MKNKYIVAMLASVAMLWSCDQELDYDPGNPAPINTRFTGTNSSVIVVNAQPGKRLPAEAPFNLNLQFNNVPLTTGTPATNVAVPYLGTSPTTSATNPYTAVPASPATLVRATNASSNQSLGAVSINSSSTGRFTVFVIDSIGRPDGNRLISLTDDISAPTTGNAKVRFLHFSPNAPRVEVRNAATNGILFSERGYAQVSSGSTQFGAFSQVPAGTYDLSVRTIAAQPADVVEVLTVNGVVLQAGKIYTIYARGLVNGPAGQELGASIIVHNP